MHDADQRGPFRQRLLDVIRVHKPMTVHRHDGDAAAEPLQKPARLHRRRMLDAANDEMCPGAASKPLAEKPLHARKHNALESMIARLGPATRKDDFIRLRPEQVANLTPG